MYSSIKEKNMTIFLLCSYWAQHEGRVWKKGSQCLINHKQQLQQLTDPIFTTSYKSNHRHKGHASKNNTMDTDALVYEFLSNTTVSHL